MRIFGVKNHPTQILIQKSTSCISFGKYPQRRERDKRKSSITKNFTTGKFYSIMMGRKEKVENMSDRK